VVDQAPGLAHAHQQIVNQSAYVSPLVDPIWSVLGQQYKQINVFPNFDLQVGSISPDEEFWNTRWFYFAQFAVDNRLSTGFGYFSRPITQYLGNSNSEMLADLEIGSPLTDTIYIISNKLIWENARSALANRRNYTRYKIPNISVQKWNNLTLSIDTRTLDVYLDGKLRNSFIMHGLYNNFYSTSEKKNIYIGNMAQGTSAANNEGLNSGFEGFITRIRYENDSINPQEAYNIYKEGIDKSLAKSLFNKYRLKVSFLEYNTEKGSFEI
jgi:hypothetical protein